MNTENIKELGMFFKKLALSLTLIGFGSVVTLGIGSYVWLKVDKARLEDQKANLIIERSNLILELEEAQANLNLGL